MISTHSELLPRLIPRVRLCPEPLALQALIDAGHDLCRHGVWQKALGPVDVVAGQEDYSLSLGFPDVDPPPEVFQVLWVKINGASISPRIYDVVPTGDLAPEDEYKLQFDEGYAPGSEITDGLTLRVSLVPHAASSYLPPDILTQFGNDMVWGAVAALQSQAQRPWYDPQGAALAMQEWSGGLATAIQRRTLGRRVGALRVNNRARPWE